MGNERGSMDPVTVALVVLFILLFAGVVFWALRDSLRRTDQMKQLAASHRWSFSSGDSDDLSYRLEPYFPKQTFSASRIVTVEAGERVIRLFDCQHKYRNQSKSLRFRTGCIIESSRFGRALGPTEVVGIFDRTALDALWIDGPLDLGDDAFRESFIAAAKDRPAAERVLTPAMQAAIAGHRGSSCRAAAGVAITGSGAAVLTDRDASAECMLELVELCRRIEAALP